MSPLDRIRFLILVASLPVRLDDRRRTYYPAAQRPSYRTNWAHSYYATSLASGPTIPAALAAPGAPPIDVCTLRLPGGFIWSVNGISPQYSSPTIPPDRIAPGLALFTCDLELGPPCQGGPRSNRDDEGIRVGLPRLLSLLDRHGVSATFFAEAGLARTHRPLLQELRVRGHEIGLHGYAHESYAGVYYGPGNLPLSRRLPARRRREYLLRFRHLLLESTGGEVRSFRAPFLQIDPTTGRLSAPYHPRPADLAHARSFPSLEGIFLEIPVSVEPQPHPAPYLPFRHLKPGDPATTAQTINLIEHLSAAARVPPVVVFLTHPWEFADRPPPYPAPPGEEFCRLLDALLEALHGPERFQFLTMSRTACLWERQYCPWHRRAPDDTAFGDLQ